MNLPSSAESHTCGICQQSGSPKTVEAKLNTGPTPCYFKLSKVRRPVTTEKEGKKTNSQEQKDKSLKFVSRRPVKADRLLSQTGIIYLCTFNCDTKSPRILTENCYMVKKKKNNNICYKQSCNSMFTSTLQQIKWF